MNSCHPQRTVERQPIRTGFKNWENISIFCRIGASSLDQSQTQAQSDFTNRGVKQSSDSFLHEIKGTVYEIVSISTRKLFYTSLCFTLFVLLCVHFSFSVTFICLEATSTSVVHIITEIYVSRFKDDVI